MNEYLVSIVTPTYNSASTIRETYNSICIQSYSNWEWVVTDDCSTDETHQILCNLAKQDSRIKVFRNLVNSGSAISRNNSLKNASGCFVCFIDSDDLWDPNKLELQIRFMLNNNIDFSFTAYELIDEYSTPLNKVVDNQSKSCFSYYDMLKKNATLGCSTVMLKRSILPSELMPNIRTGQDYAFWLTMLKSGINAYLLREVLTKYRIMPNSISRNKFKKALRQWEIYRTLEKLPVMRSIYYFFFYAFHAVFRK